MSAMLAPRYPTSFPYHPSNVHKALLGGRKASDELKLQATSNNQSQPVITTSSYVEGVGQTFIFHGKTTIMIPYTLTQNIQRTDMYNLLEALRVEQLLTDEITSSATHISNLYYSQVLMAHRLQRAQLEVKLYKLAIEKDGLYLLCESNDDEDSEDEEDPANNDTGSESDRHRSLS